MNELDVMVKQTPGVIESNFDEIKAALAVQMSAYTALEVTEENIPESKKDLATLRKIRKAVDDRRKDIKKTFMQPYDAFEAQVREVLGVIDEPIALISGKLNGFEEKRIAERQAHLLALYEANIGDLAEYLPFVKVKTPQWDNKTCTDNAIISEISAARMKVKSDIEAIRALGSEIEEDLLAKYMCSGNDLAAAIQKNALYLEAKARAEQRVSEREKEDATVEAVSGNEQFPDVAFTVAARDADRVQEMLDFAGIPYTRRAKGG